MKRHIHCCSESLILNFIFSNIQLWRRYFRQAWITNRRSITLKFRYIIVGMCQICLFPRSCPFFFPTYIFALNLAVCCYHEVRWQFGYVWESVCVYLCTCASICLFYIYMQVYTAKGCYQLGARNIKSYGIMSGSSKGA